MANLCELSRISSNAGTKLVEAMGKKAPQGLQKTVEETVTLPSVGADIAATASSNYAIGGIVMRDAKKPVAEVSSEFMTHLDADGKTLVRKLTNGKTVKTLKLPDGTTKTTVILPDGQEYTRLKKIKETALSGVEQQELQQVFSKNNDMLFDFRRIDKEISMTGPAREKQGLKPVQMAKTGRIYATSLADGSCKPLIKYNAKTAPADMVSQYNVELNCGTELYPKKHNITLTKKTHPEYRTLINGHIVEDTRPNHNGVWRCATENDEYKLSETISLNDLVRILDLPKGKMY